MAHLEKRTEEDTAYHCLLAAAEKYALSLYYSSNNPQVMCQMCLCFTLLKCTNTFAAVRLVLRKSQRLCI